GWVRDTVSARGGVSPAPLVPLREMTTTSLDAFRLYTEGTEARKHLRVGDAKRLLLEAVRIDPAFALAYFELQEIAMWQQDEGGYEEFRQKTLQNQERLPPQKRMLLEASELWKQDPKRAEQILKDLIERNPEEEDAYLQLAHLCRSSYRPEESLAVLERGVGALPHSGYLRLYYGYGLLWQGRFPEAIHQFEVYSRINPEEANPSDSMGEAYLIAGIPERALEKYAHALEIDPKFSSSHLGRAWAFGQLGRFRDALAEIDLIRGDLPPHFTADELSFLRAYLMSRAGRYREAEGLIAELVKQSSPGVTLAARQFHALLDIERGRTQEAVRTIQAISTPMPEGVQGGNGSRQLAALTKLLGGVAAARAGDLSTSQKYLAELGEIYEADDPRESWWYYLLLGELALASGDARAAHAAFTQGEPRLKLSFNVTKPLESLGGGLMFRDGPARALAAQGKRRAAIELYRDLLRPDIGHKWTAVLEPRFHLQLARLERAENQRVEASKHYRDFLELWSDADRYLPELREAESYLASAS
ncbi:MAG: tetratricopeptide repeat protein, partial [Vicinamibacteria bacterium]